MAVQGNFSTETAVYEIRVGVTLNGSYWSNFFDDITVTPHENGETTLRGTMVDQAALYGLLAKLRNLALPLIALNRIEKESDSAT
jgi:hypothetical protein